MGGHDSLAIEESASGEGWNPDIDHCGLLEKARNYTKAECAWMTDNI